jgi:hypothetical protein
MTRPDLPALRPLVFDRARGRCEMVNEFAVRCRNQADELHHRLPRRPGGTRLDVLATAAARQDELEPRHLAHLAALCSVCHHEVAHGDPKRAVRLGLRVIGEVRHERWSGETFYVGPDVEMSRLWPQTDVA